MGTLTLLADHSLWPFKGLLSHIGSKYLPPPFLGILSQKAEAYQCFDVSMSLFFFPDASYSGLTFGLDIGFNTHTALVLNLGLNQMRLSEKFNILMLGRVKTRLCQNQQSCSD
jgi:hypothetical protein